MIDLSLYFATLLLLGGLIIVLIGFIIVILIAGFLIYGGLFARKLPYVPTKKDKLEKMFELLDLKEGEKVIDCGSGDGRFVLESAQRGAYAVGYEINPFLVAYSRWFIRQKGLEEKASVQRQSLFEADFRTVDAVTLYCVSEVMEALETRLLDELRVGGRVVSNSFQFPNWKPLREEEGVYLYVKK